MPGLGHEDNYTRDGLIYAQMSVYSFFPGNFNVVLGQFEFLLLQYFISAHLDSFISHLNSKHQFIISIDEMVLNIENKSLVLRIAFLQFFSILPLYFLI